MVCEAEPRAPRLLDRVRAPPAARHYSRRTEGAFAAWIRRYIVFHDKRHPTDMGAPEITRFLSSLAVEGNVAASTQNQALSAVLFLYRDVLAVDLPWLDGIVRAKRPQRLPVVLTRDEVRAVLRRLDGAPRLMAYLLYGAGLSEAARETRTASRCCPPRSSRTSPATLRRCGTSIVVTSNVEPAGPSF